jgi:hypothetical protein
MFLLNSMNFYNESSESDFSYREECSSDASLFTTKAKGSWSEEESDK